MWLWLFVAVTGQLQGSSTEHITDIYFTWSPQANSYWRHNVLLYKQVNQSVCPQEVTRLGVAQPTLLSVKAQQGPVVETC